MGQREFIFSQSFEVVQIQD